MLVFPYVLDNKQEDYTIKFIRDIHASTSTGEYLKLTFTYKYSNL